ncbi:hypothetical protein CTI12_AA454100 [Artemisia annua]|uniref:Uncharacterized protein n=1 Tax=Artemisia annua TaxID=35608 RepID=A0A2U1LTX6_ARTAN|nr:hypothetical protein CTI12_AA454100 [Artemisia annua]
MLCLGGVVLTLVLQVLTGTQGGRRRAILRLIHKLGVPGWIKGRCVVLSVVGGISGERGSSRPVRRKLFIEGPEETTKQYTTPTEPTAEENEALTTPLSEQPATEPQDTTAAIEDQPVATTHAQQATAEAESSQPSKKAKHN